MTRLKPGDVLPQNSIPKETGLRPSGGLVISGKRKLKGLHIGDVVLRRQIGDTSAILLVVEAFSTEDMTIFKRCEWLSSKPFKLVFAGSNPVGVIETWLHSPIGRGHPLKTGVSEGSNPSGATWVLGEIGRHARFGSVNLNLLGSNALVEHSYMRETPKAFATLRVTMQRIRMDNPQGSLCDPSESIRCASHVDDDVLQTTNSESWRAKAVVARGSGSRKRVLVRVQ